MRNSLLSTFALASIILLGGCSTSKIAQTDVNDDVYYSTARAKEATLIVQQEQKKEYVTEREVYADEDSYSGYYDDYSVRINRFHRYSPWRGYYDTYYDPFYTYSPYSYNRYYRPGVNVNVYVGSGYGYGYNPYWNHNHYWSPYGYGYGYGYPYHSNYWGMQSYYNSYPYYGGYYGNQGYYYGGMGRDIQSSPNYRPRPTRDFENMPAGTRRPAGSGYAGGNSTGTITDTRSRTERYNDGNRGIAPPSSTGNTRTSTTTARPTRTETERPTRTSSTPQRTSDDSRTTIQSRPTRVESSFPPSNSGSSSSSGRSDSGSGSSSPSSGRPSRGY